MFQSDQGLRFRRGGGATLIAALALAALSALVVAYAQNAGFQPDGGGSKDVRLYLGRREGWFYLAG